MKPPHVLIVDDEEGLRRFLSILLEKEGIHAVTAKSGSDALLLVERGGVDVVLTDIKMPGMSGLELLRRIRRFDPHLPVIVMTAYASLDSAVEAVNEGAFHYFVKQSKNDQILEAINSALAHRKSKGDARPRAADLARNRPVADLYPFIMGGLVHDSMNAILAIRGNADILNREVANRDLGPRVMRSVETVSACAERLSQTVSLIQSISREYYEPNTANGGTKRELLTGLCANVKRANGDLCLTWEIEDGIEEWEFPFGVLWFIVGELLSNAARACRDQEGAEVDLRIGTPDDGDTLEIVCRDSGPGFQEEALADVRGGRVVERRVGEGRGYGLYFVREIVGRVGQVGDSLFLVENLTPNGAQVLVHLPTSGDR